MPARSTEGSYPHIPKPSGFLLPILMSKVRMFLSLSQLPNCLGSPCSAGYSSPPSHSKGATPNMLWIIFHVKKKLLGLLPKGRVSMF